MIYLWEGQKVKLETERQDQDEWYCLIRLQDGSLTWVNEFELEEDKNEEEAGS